MLVDSHCHLDFVDFDADREALIARAHAAGVGGMLTISTRLDAFSAVRAIAERFAPVCCSIGVHPHEAKDYSGDGVLEALIEATRHPKVVGVGETGLDYFYEHSPREAQQACFRQHIEAARRTGLPLIIHTRDADLDMAAMLRQAQAGGRIAGVLHCFSSSSALAEAALELGFYISLSGIVTFRKAEELREIARGIPMDRLLVETDAPYLAPVPNRGKRNEPAYVAQTAAAVAALKGIDPAALAAQTTENYYRLFAKAGAHRAAAELAVARAPGAP
jgi:TatD DNase family protein